MVDLGDDALIDTVREGVRQVIGERSDAEPVFTRVIRWGKAIPQYELGHLDRVASVEAACGRIPGLWVGGNALRGVSLAECAADALATARGILSAGD